MFNFFVLYSVYEASVWCIAGQDFLLFCRLPPHSYSLYCAEGFEFDIICWFLLWISRLLETISKSSCSVWKYFLWFPLSISRFQVYIKTLIHFKLIFVQSKRESSLIFHVSPVSFVEDVIVSLMYDSGFLAGSQVVLSVWFISLFSIPFHWLCVFSMPVPCWFHDYGSAV